ncbi:MAG: hypothetical protein IPI67_17215 [Myxococcales bacterium]|nr:hypothetical protein [Myxococcales bacterium]
MRARFICGCSLLVLAVFACSSENSTEVKATGGAGGTGGSGTGGSSASGGSGGSVATGGAAGVNATGGVAGTVATGGAAGTAATGGAAGSGGSGAQDAGGDAGGAGGSVSCGSQSCDLATGFCCVIAKTPTCAVKGSNCVGDDILCDGKEDCDGGKICCKSTSPFTAGDAAITSNVTCSASCSNSVPLGSKIQVCKVTGECVTGSCKPAASGSALPVGYKTCQL